MSQKLAPLRLISVVLLIITAPPLAAEPLYIDELIETPVADLQTILPDLGSEGCYAIGDGQFLLVAIDSKDQKPWRVVLSWVEPCSEPRNAGTLDVRLRRRIGGGDSTTAVVEQMGRPDLTSQADDSLRRFGETEYFYVCRVDEGCARHTSVVFRQGKVTAVAEWYSQ